MGRRELPSVVIEAARARGVPRDSLSLLPGAAGLTWAVSPTEVSPVPRLATWPGAAGPSAADRLLDIDLSPLDRYELAGVNRALSDFDKQAPVNDLAEGHGGPQ